MCVCVYIYIYIYLEKLISTHLTQTILQEGPCYYWSQNWSQKSSYITEVTWRETTRSKHPPPTWKTQLKPLHTSPRLYYKRTMLLLCCQMWQQQKYFALQLKFQRTSQNHIRQTWREMLYMVQYIVYNTKHAESLRAPDVLPELLTKTHWVPKWREKFGLPMFTT